MTFGYGDLGDAEEKILKMNRQAVLSRKHDNSIIVGQIPTAEQMIGWLEEQGFYFYIFKDYCWNGEVQYGNNWYYSIDDVNSRKEATIAAIDAALEYLSNNKK